MAHEPDYNQDDLERREMNPDDFDEEDENTRPHRQLEYETVQDSDDIESGWGQEEPGDKAG